MAKNNFNKDVIINFACQIVVLIMTFLMNKVISILAEPAGYTLFSLFNKVSSVFSFVMAFSLGIAVPRYISMSHALSKIDEEYCVFSESLKICVSISLAIACVLFVFKGFFANLLFDSDNTVFIDVMIFTSFSTALFTLACGYFRGLNRYIAFSVMQICSALIGFSVSYFVKKSINHYFFMKSVLVFVLSFACIIYFYRYYKIRQSKNISSEKFRKTRKELLKYCIPRVPGEFVLFAFSAVPLLIMNKRFGLLSSTGFAAGVTIIGAITPFFGMIGTILLPYVSKSIVAGQEERQQLNHRISILLLIYVVIGFCATAGVLILPKLVVWFFFTSDYFVYIRQIQIMCISILPQAIYYLLRNPIDAAFCFPFNSVMLVISFSVMIVFFCLCSTIEQALWGYVISYFILGILCLLVWFIYVHKEKV